MKLSIFNESVMIAALFLTPDTLLNEVKRYEAQGRQDLADIYWAALLYLSVGGMCSKVTPCKSCQVVAKESSLLIAEYVMIGA